LNVPLQRSKTKDKRPNQQLAIGNERSQMMKRKILVSFVIFVVMFCVARINGFAQEEKPKTEQKTEQKDERPRVAEETNPQKDDKAQDDKSKKDDKKDKKEKTVSEVPENIRSNRKTELLEDESAIVPYYNNFFTNYYLGPEDVISVDVFTLERYSRKGITVPPNGKIALPLIGSISVVGKTTEQVQEEVTKLLAEYVIDPKVTVSLDKAMSARYSVLGDVGQPGIKIMTRRLNINEAIAEAGGVQKTGDKKKVVILRRQPDGNVVPIPVNVNDIEKGKSKGMIFLVPGDQIVVPSKKWTLDNILKIPQVLSFAYLFRGF
jgi:polysaccharide export outer membrane protein